MRSYQTLHTKKRFGQHFLHDTRIAQKIVQTLSPNPSYQAVVEIGPGTGALTEWLVKDVQCPLYLVEIDAQLVKRLHQEYPKLKDRIIEGDFLKFPLQKITKEPIAIIGNFPYNISSQILLRIFHQHNQVAEVVCMLQKEVADRICAQPRNKTYGLLSVLLQTFYKVTYCFTVGPSSFSPAPKVTSAVIHLTRNTTKELPCDEKFFFSLVKMAFSTRRKMLRNALHTLTKGNSNIPKAMLNQRAEALSSQDFIQLAEALEANKKHSK